MTEETYTLTLTATQMHTLIYACDDSEEVTVEKLACCPGDYDTEETEAMVEHIEECDKLSSALIVAMFPNLIEPIETQCTNPL